MAQNGSHGHQDGAGSDDGHSTPATPVTFSLTSAGPYGNDGSSADNLDNMDAGVKGKNLIPDLNMMEERDSMDGSKDKPRSVAEIEVEVAAADADADADADDGELNLYVNILLERAERRKRMKDGFRSLRAVLPHVPPKTDKVTLMGEAIRYIRFLEDKAAMLWAAARGEASSSSSSFPLTAMPQIAQNMTALSSDAPRGWSNVPVPPAPTFLGLPITFKRWSGQNFVLAVANDKAYIRVRVPQRPNSLTTVMSLLDNHGIDVITAQISSDSVSSQFFFFVQVTGTDGANRSSEEVFQSVVSEIMVNNYNNN